MKIFLLSFVTLLCFIVENTIGQKGQADSVRREQIRMRWNKSLVHDTAYTFSKEANMLLQETIMDLPSGKALDVAMGQGRNALFLASRGWEVTGFDLADEAVNYAKEKAKANNLKITTSISDMETYDYGTDKWDLITWIYGGCLEVDQIAEKIKTSLKSGGLFLFEFFHRDAGLAMGRPEFGCETDAIKNKFIKVGGFTIIRYEEKTGIADYSLQPYKLIYFVARKN